MAGVALLYGLVFCIGRSTLDHASRMEEGDDLFLCRFGASLDLEASFGNLAGGFASSLRAHGNLPNPQWQSLFSSLIGMTVDVRSYG